MDCPSPVLIWFCEEGFEMVDQLLFYVFRGVSYFPLSPGQKSKSCSHFFFGSGICGRISYFDLLLSTIEV
jgi:hypothetical protein